MRSRGVRWCVLWLEISPALKGFAPLWLCQHKLRIEDQLTIVPAISVCERVHRQNGLPDKDCAFDHPVDGATIQQFIHALRCLPGFMDWIGRFAARFAFPGATRLPDLKIFDSFRADTKFNEMNHVRNLVGIGKIRSPF